MEKQNFKEDLIINHQIRIYEEPLTSPFVWFVMGIINLLFVFLGLLYNNDFINILHITLLIILAFFFNLERTTKNFMKVNLGFVICFFIFTLGYKQIFLNTNISMTLASTIIIIFVIFMTNAIFIDKGKSSNFKEEKAIILDRLNYKLDINEICENKEFKQTKKDEDFPLSLFDWIYLLFTQKSMLILSVLLAYFYDMALLLIYSIFLFILILFIDNQNIKKYAIANLLILFILITLYIVLGLILGFDVLVNQFKLVLDQYLQS